MLHVYGRILSLALINGVAIYAMRELLLRAIDYFQVSTGRRYRTAEQWHVRALAWYCLGLLTTVLIVAILASALLLHAGGVTAVVIIAILLVATTVLFCIGHDVDHIAQKQYYREREVSH